MVTKHRLLTYEDYAALPEDGPRYELIGGELYEMPAPARVHQELVARLFILLRTFVSARHLGKVYMAPFDIRLSPHDVVQPDILYVSRERAKGYGPNYLMGGPDLAVEVLSPSTRQRDLTVKRDLYALADVRELWFGDVEAPSLQILALRDGQYVPIPETNSIIEST
ncbi:MAG TPA: Uma2 family endonuclease, partial [Thermomicrobiales bacterium]|nr:Uma2 family endonuclease [Thermomicrobiales bacterium]